MNKYPLWKYLLVAFAVLAGLVYALPNLYWRISRDPDIAHAHDQSRRTGAGACRAVAAARPTSYSATQLDDKSARVRFADTDTQLRARDLVQKELGDGYTVALNLLPDTPRWLASLNARPMYLGLDLRGGVYFLMQVDMRAVIKKAGETYADDIRRILRDKSCVISGQPARKRRARDALQGWTGARSGASGIAQGAARSGVRGKRARRRIHCHRPAQRSGAQGEAALCARTEHHLAQ